MSIRLLLIALVVFQSLPSCSQAFWEWVPGAPTFTQADTGTITDIHFVDDSVGYLITNTGDVYGTHDGGSNWDSLSRTRNYTPTLAYQYADAINNIKFINRDTGFVLMESDTILYMTTNGGLAWQPFAIAPANPAPYLWSISTSGHILSCLYSSYRSILFTKDYSNNTIRLDTLPYRNNITEFILPNQNTGVFWGDSSWRGKIFHTGNQGATWTLVYTLPSGRYVNTLYLTDENYGYALCSANSYNNKFFLIKTTDGGFTWNNIPGADTLELYLGIKMLFINEMTGWIAYPDQGLLETTDGGLSWHFVYEGQHIYCFAKTPSGMVYGAGKNVIRIDSRLLNSVEPVSKNNIKSFIIYPNPTTDYFTVQTKWDKLKLPVQLKVFDVLGNKLLEQNNYLSEPISVSGLCSGIYQVQISSPDSTVFEILVITTHH